MHHAQGVPEEFPVTWNIRVYMTFPPVPPWLIMPGGQVPDGGLGPTTISFPQPVEAAGLEPTRM